jgi:hypothetical protein
LADNYAEYDHRQSRGAPHQGKLLLQDLVYCGECGHKMEVSYQERNRYQCQYQWQVQREPVCQNIPAELIDEQVVQAFFQALSPIELDAYEQVLFARQATRKSSAPRPSSSSGCCMKPPWQSASTIKSIRTIAWWQPS